MTNTESKELAGWAVQQARKSGATDVAVQLGESRGVEIEYRDQQIDKLQESVRCSLRITIYLGRRYSVHSTNDLSKAGLEKFIAEAVSMTKYLGEDRYRALPDPKYYAGRKQVDLKLADASFDAITTAQKIKLAQETEAVAHAASDKIISVTSSFSDGYGQSYRIHSNGFEGELESTNYSMSAEVSVRDDNSRPEDYDYASVRHFSKLPSPEELGKSAARYALRKLGQKKLGSGRMEMIVENRVTSHLVRDLISPLSGRSLQQKSSYLDNMLNKPVTAANVTLVDDPFVPEGMGSELFDGEGMASQRRVVVEQGVLKTYFIDSYYARKMGVEPTTGGTSNLSMTLGKRAFAELVKDVKKGILVTGFVGGNSNATTGDFSMGVTGQYIENGVILYPVNEMNVSGNYKELWKQLVEIGSDPFPYGAWRIPTLRFENVQFSGK
jgi:PmbA protein